MTSQHEATCKLKLEFSDKIEVNGVESTTPDSISPISPYILAKPQVSRVPEVLCRDSYTICDPVIALKHVEFVLKDNYGNAKLYSDTHTLCMSWHFK